uniref:Uncharacterized protein n=1 Tax=Ursus americanus TaxID=9643 RepID=A0A452SVA9_URSAM
MPPTGLEPARMNRKKGDKGFESPRKSVVVSVFSTIISSNKFKHPLQYLETFPSR